MLLAVGMSFDSLPVVALGFATLGFGFAELVVQGAFAGTLTVVDVVVGGEERGTLRGVVALLGFAKLVLVVAISNPGVAAVATFVTLFSPGIFPCGCWVVAVVPAAVVAVLASTPPSSVESSS